VSGKRSAALVRRWVALYTRGLPADVRRDRRDEIEDDLWSQLSDKENAERAAATRRDVLARLVLGIPDDITWRIAQRRVGPRRRPIERSQAVNTRFAAVLAILGGVGWTIFGILAAIGGSQWWANGQWDSRLLAIVPILAFSAVCFVVVGAYPDRLSAWAASLAVIGAVLGAMAPFGLPFGIVALPIASALLVYELGRDGVLPSAAAWLHVAGSVVMLGFTVWILAGMALGWWNWRGPEGNSLLAVVPWALSWVAVGRSLWRVPVVARGSASAS